MADKHRIYIVEDDAALRDALSLMFQALSLDIAAFASAEEFLAELDPGTPACVLADVMLPGMNGLELLAKINDLNLELPVILLTGHGTVPMAVAALRAGASNFIEKPFDALVLRQAVEEVLATSGKVIPPSVEEARHRAVTLTAREREIATLLVQGRTNKDIGLTLGISPRTVEVHRSRIKEKTETQNLSDLVRLWIAAGYS